MPGQSESTDTLFYIDKISVPDDRWRDNTNARVVVNYRTEKEDPCIVRLCFGGDRIHFPWDCGTPTLDMLTVKLLLNSIFSTPNAKCMSINIKDFYLNTQMPRYEYMGLKLSDLPEDVISHYNLREKLTKNEYIYTEIWRGMYKLPAAGILSQRLLKKKLNKRIQADPGYTRFLDAQLTPSEFSLCTDYFGVKYVGKEYANHLMVVLSKI